MISIELFSPFSSSYIDDSISIYLTGQFEYEGTYIHEAKEIMDLIMRVFPDNNGNGFSKFFHYDLLEKANGSFSIIIKMADATYIAADIIRSHPVFIISTENDNLVITDSLSEIGINMQTDLAKLEEFVACGLVPGNKTVYKNVIALQAGEGLTIVGKEIISKRYFEFKPAENPETYENLTKFSNAFDKVLLSAFSRMIDQNPSVNRWVVPLSGGHDSRLILNYLYRLGVSNVICFTYGKPDNEQARISKMVADALGYEWHFIEYTSDKWHSLHNNNIINKYIIYSFNGVSTPHLQDFLAVYELKEKGIIKVGDIFLPGHTCISERFLESNLYYESKKDLFHDIYKLDLASTPGKFINDKVIEILDELYIKTRIKSEFFRPFVDWQERQSKFIMNSIKVYSYFGFETRLPLWDKALTYFWLNFPDREQRDRKVFYQSEKKGILIDVLQQIPYAGGGVKPSKTGIQSSLKKILPGFLSILLLRLTKRNTDSNERLNLVFSLEANSVKDLLEPVKDFPKQTRPYFKHILNRYPFQVNPHFLTSLFTIRNEVLKK